MSELPQSWTMTTPIAVAEPIRGVTYKKEQARDTPATGFTGLLRANNIQQNKLDLSDLVFVPEENVSQNQMLKKHDVVIAMSSGSISVVGKSAQVHDEPNASFGAFCGALRPTSEIDPRYFGHFLKSEAYRSAISNLARGVNINNLKWSHFEEIALPLAPLPEQKRIADKLDSTLARVDACRNRLDRLPALLKRFRQSILAAATSGRLTEDWRANRSPDKAQNQTGAQAKTDVPSWTYERAADVCGKVQSGGTPKEGFTDTGVPFLKVYNIVDQEISFDYKPQYITPEIHSSSMSKSQVMPGDVLMNIVGPPLGKVAIVPRKHPAWNINQAITLFRPSSKITSGWLYCILCGGENIADVLHETKGSAGQVNISLSQCRDFVFPIPPIAEQDEIVRRVEFLFAFADRLEARLATARKQAERLTPALLAKAFRGELVPQDPNDEPASELLKRLAANQTDAPKPKRGRKAAT